MDFKCNLSPSAKLKSSWKSDKNITLCFDPQVLLLLPACGLFQSSLMYGMSPSGYYNKRGTRIDSHL